MISGKSIVPDKVKLFKLFIDTGKLCRHGMYLCRSIGGSRIHNLPRALTIAHPLEVSHCLDHAGHSSTYIQALREELT